MSGPSALTDNGVSVGAWNALVRRARIGRARKVVALTVSSYANADGTGIHCGIATLAVDCEIGYSTARSHLAWLRKVGLVELVRRGNRRRGLSDEYRLILGPEVLEHVDVSNPERYKALKDELREANKAGQKSRHQRSSGCGADGAEQTGGPPEPSAPAQVSAETPDQRSPDNRSALTQDERPPSLHTYPEEHTSPPTDAGDLRTDLAVVDDQQDPESVDEVEGMPAPPVLRLVDTADVPRPPPQGHGFCIHCYATGQTVLAADPAFGSACTFHLRSNPVLTVAAAQSSTEQETADATAP